MGQGYTFSDFYKCGAQVTLMISGFPLLEAVGIGFTAHESKLPIYGYSSRFFDALGRGRVLVEGSLFVNWVHQDQLYQAINIATLNGGTLSYGDYSRVGLSELDVVEELNGSDVRTDQEAASFVENSIYQIQQGWSNLTEAKINLEKAFYDNSTRGNQGHVGYAGTYNPHDQFGPLSLRIIAGQPSTRLPTGDFGLDLTSLHFTGRGLRLQLSEDVIVEQHMFIARNLNTLEYSDIIGDTPPSFSIDITASTESRFPGATRNAAGQIELTERQWFEQITQRERISGKYAVKNAMDYTQ